MIDHTTKAILDKMQDDHMSPVIERGGAWLVETGNGTEIVPDWLVGLAIDDDGGLYRAMDGDMIDDERPRLLESLTAALSDYLEDTSVESATYRADGYCYRLSAAGYLDCTPWGFAETEQAAAEALASYAD